MSARRVPRPKANVKLLPSPAKRRRTRDEDLAEAGELADLVLELLGVVHDVLDEARVLEPGDQFAFDAYVAVLLRLAHRGEWTDVSPGTRLARRILDVGREAPTRTGGAS